jgi:hypothetical protein
VKDYALGHSLTLLFSFNIENICSLYANDITPYKNSKWYLIAENACRRHSPLMAQQETGKEKSAFQYAVSVAAGAPQNAVSEVSDCPNPSLLVNKM